MDDPQVLEGGTAQSAPPEVLFPLDDGALVAELAVMLCDPAKSDALVCGFRDSDQARVPLLGDGTRLLLADIQRVLAHRATQGELFMALADTPLATSALTELLVLVIRQQ